LLPQSKPWTSIKTFGSEPAKFSNLHIRNRILWTNDGRRKLNPGPTEGFTFVVNSKVIGPLSYIPGKEFHNPS
jgi:hypothetical protein